MEALRRLLYGNSSADNCGTGAGGFQPGNTCGAKGQEPRRQEYVGSHQAPMSDSGKPAHDLTEVYPDDIYGPQGALYYGHHGGNHPMDVRSVQIIKSLRGRPNASVAIYRAVPEVLSNAEKIALYQSHKDYILKRGKLPPDAEREDMSRSAYYDWIDGEMARLKTAPEPELPDYQIHRGDWVTINRDYAKEHGAAQFGSRYKILKRAVRARDIYTNGDSIHEWGYDPALAGKDSANSSGPGIPCGGSHIAADKVCRIGGGTVALRVKPASLEHLPSWAEPATPGDISKLQNAFNGIPEELRRHARAYPMSFAILGEDSGRTAEVSGNTIYLRRSDMDGNAPVARHELTHAFISRQISQADADKKWRELESARVRVPVHAAAAFNDGGAYAGIDEFATIVTDGYKSGMTLKEHAAVLAKEARTGDRVDCVPEVGSRNASYRGCGNWTQEEAERAVGLWRGWLGWKEQVPNELANADGDWMAKPRPFKEAVGYVAQKHLLPTTLSSEELMALDAAVRERAMFSARTANAWYLQQIKDKIDNIVGPVTSGGKPWTGVNAGSARAQLKDALRSIGYQPAPGDRGTIKDLASDQRLNLIVGTQTDMAHGFAQRAQSMTGPALEMWPAFELYRAEQRNEPRDWPQRWQEAGGEFFPGDDADYPEGRMVALKTDGIWEDISAFGLPYPPFDFNSGMDIRQVSREECVELGLIDEDWEPEAGGEAGLDPADFEGGEASAEQFDPEMLEALLGTLGEGYKVVKGVLTLGNDGGQPCGGSFISGDKVCRVGAGAATPRVKATPKWSSPYTGRHELVGKDGTWVIEKRDDGFWAIVDPKTGGDFDSHKTLAVAKRMAEAYSASNNIGNEAAAILSQITDCLCVN